MRKVDDGAEDDEVEDDGTGRRPSTVRRGARGTWRGSLAAGGVMGSTWRRPPAGVAKHLVGTRRSALLRRQLSPGDGLAQVARCPTTAD
jgi:hypothetical protein